MSTKLYTIGFFAAASWLGAAGAAVPLPAVTDAESRFVAARDAFRAGERVRLGKLGESLRGTDYAAWVEHWQLRLRFEEDSTEGLAGFLEREKSSYLGEKTRSEWVKHLGRQKRWEAVGREFPQLLQPDQEASCYGLQARLANGDGGALDDARPLWFQSLDLPEACQPLLDRLHAEARVSTDDVWNRIRRLLEAKKQATAKAMTRYLRGADALDPRKLDQVADNPARHLARLPAEALASRPARELALFAVQRMARSDPAATASQWRGMEPGFPAEERAYAWAQLGWQGAMRHMREANEWYAAAGTLPPNEEVHAWKARSLLRARHWSGLARAIGEMPGKLAAQPEWIYWLGRAQAAQGLQADAEGQFLKIAGQPNFYGNLADEELGRPVTIPPRAAAPSPEELAEATANVGLRRALAVLRTDMRIEGVREWVWNLRGMNDRQLLAAAELARRHSVWDRTINTADRTTAEHDYALRYLAPYRDQVSAKARELALDDGWVYGLMRQESRFVMDARSSAGAKGLMQLMPATASWVARKIGLADYHPGRVTEMDTNVTLGTRYLKMVLDSLDNHPVLASAAYNAGPGRARKWRAEWPLEGAIYAETIPFNETRDYVKKVMSNAIYYATLFESRPQSLKTRLGVVRPRGSNDSGAAALP
jgi:soluble lytic murein transglycosylase